MYSLGRFLQGLWRGLDALRRFLHLLLLLAIFALGLGVLRQETPRVPEKAALVVRPSGNEGEGDGGGAFEPPKKGAGGRGGAPDTALGSDHGDSRSGRRCAHWRAA